MDKNKNTKTPKHKKHKDVKPLQGDINFIIQTEHQENRISRNLKKCFRQVRKISFTVVSNVFRQFKFQTSFVRNFKHMTVFRLFF